MNRAPIRAISLWQPWATLIALGHKRYETRSWGTAYRGPLAIHAAKRPMGPDGRGLLVELDEIHGISIDPRALPFGAIVAVGRLADCRQMSIDMCRSIWSAAGPEFAVGGWAPGRWAWRLEDIRALPEPSPFRGAQGLFPWIPPETLEPGAPA